MSAEQWEHWEKLAKKHELETRTVKKQLYHAGKIIGEKNQEIEFLKKELKCQKATNKGMKWSEEIKHNE